MSKPVKIWKVPELWPESTVFIIGGGPSTKNEDFSGIHNRRVIAANHSFKFGNWVDLTICCDYRRWDEMEPDIVKHPGLVVVPAEPLKYPRFSKMKANMPLYIKTFKKGWSTKRDTIARNRNTGTGAINLAYLLGAVKVVLIGFDMKTHDGKANWHEVMKRDPSIQIRERAFPEHLRHFYLAVAKGKECGMSFYNTSIDSAIDEKKVPKISLKEYLNKEACNEL